MSLDDVRVTARTIRTELGTTHTVYRVGEREFYDADEIPQQFTER